MYKMFNKLKLFLGTKIDLREDKETLQFLADGGQAPIKREQGQKLANKIRAVKYLECSALTQRGLKQVIIYQGVIGVQLKLSFFKSLGFRRSGAFCSETSTRPAEAKKVHSIVEEANLRYSDLFLQSYYANLTSET
jgi:hypothetical protein